jgi:hypothetical protein
MTINTPEAQSLSFAHGKLATQSRVKINFPGTLKNITIASFIYVGGFLLLGLLSASDLLDEQFALIGLHLLAALSFYIYWRLEPWGSARYDCFGAAILLLSIGLRFLSAFDTLFYGTRFDVWPTTIMVDSSLLSLHFKGEAIPFFGILLMVATWRLTVQDKLGRLTFLWGTVLSNKKHFMILYGLAVFTQVLIRAVNIDFGAMAQLFQIIYSTGVAAIYFLARSNVKAKPSAWLIKAVLLGLPLSILALSGGMKEYIFLPLIPAAIIAWLTFSSVAARLGMVIMGISVLSIAQIYVGYVRQTAWGGTDRSYSAKELVAGAIANSDEDSIANGVDSMLSRMNLSSAHAITVALAERDGFIPVEIFGGIPAGFIPRILWPDKPILRPGGEHTQRIRGSTQDIEEVDSATSAGFFPEIYLGGGIFALILFSMLYGYLVGKIQLNIFFQLPASATAVFNYMMFYSAVRFDERTIAYALTGIVLSYILMLFIFKVLALMPLGGRRS